MFQKTEDASRLQVTLSISEGLYYSLWYEPAGKKQLLTPRVSPPPKLGKKPKSIPFQTVLWAEPIYWHCVGEPWPFIPVVSETEEKFLRPTNSAAFLPNSFLFCGQIVAFDKHRMVYGGHQGDSPKEEWRADCLIDCGIPLKFTSKLHPHLDVYDNPIMRTRNQSLKLGIYVAGLIQLKPWIASGIYQPVSGSVKKMRLLGVDPSEPGFGNIRSVPFGYKLHADPDAINQQCIFMTLEVNEIGKMQFKSYPARDPESIEPQFLEV